MVSRRNVLYSAFCCKQTERNSMRNTLATWTMVVSWENAVVERIRCTGISNESMVQIETDHCSTSQHGKDKNYQIPSILKTKFSTLFPSWKFSKIEHIFTWKRWTTDILVLFYGFHAQQSSKICVFFAMHWHRMIEHNKIENEEPSTWAKSVCAISGSFWILCVCFCVSSFCTHISSIDCALRPYWNVW